MESLMRLRYKISILVGTSAIIIVIVFVAYSHSIAYKKSRLRSLAESFQELLKERPQLRRSRHSHPRDKYEEEYHRLVQELASIAYSDVRLFDEMLRILKEEQEKTGSKVGSVLRDEFSGLFSIMSSISINRILPPDRKMLGELIGMLEKTKSEDKNVAIERDCIGTAIVFHTHCGEPAENKPLTHAMLDRILTFMKEIEDKPKPDYPPMPEEYSTWAKEHASSYFCELVGGLARWYSDYPPVYQYALSIINDNDRYTSALRHSTLQALIESRTCENELVDMAIEILLETTQDRGLRAQLTLLRIGTDGYWQRRIDTPNRMKFFDALCKAAQTDPEKSVREAAIGRIKLFDDPEAKAFLEKVKAGAQK